MKSIPHLCLKRDHQIGGKFRHSFCVILSILTLFVPIICTLKDLFMFYVLHVCVRLGGTRWWLHAVDDMEQRLNKIKFNSKVIKFNCVWRYESSQGVSICLGRETVLTWITFHCYHCLRLVSLRAAELQSCEASDIWGWVIKARKWSPCRPQIHQRGAGMILNPAHSSETLRNTQKHSETRLLFDIEPTQTSLTPILQNKLDQRTGGDQWVARDHSWKPLWWWRAAESRCYKDFDWAESRQNICWQSW